MPPCLDLPSPASSVSGHGTPGSHNHARDVFVCAECQADAKQFIAIQDSICVEAGEAGESTDETDKLAHP